MGKKATIYTLEAISENPYKYILKNGDIIESNGGYRSDGWMMVYNCDGNGRYNISALDIDYDDYGTPIKALSVILDVPIDFWDDPIRIGDPEGSWHGETPPVPLDLPRLREAIGIPEFTESMIKTKEIEQVSYTYIPITYNGKKYCFYHYDTSLNFLDSLNSNEIRYIDRIDGTPKKRWLPI
jgi:hypothetical protein